MWEFGQAHHKKIRWKYRAKRQRIPCKFLIPGKSATLGQNGRDERFLFYPLGNLYLSGHWFPGPDCRTVFLFSKARKDEMVRARRVAGEILGCA